MDQRIELLPVSALFESPDNYRKTFSIEALHEMADTMRQVGVQQPLKVRPLPMMAGAEHYDYEIIFGHRRYRAAKLAELERVPCMVEEMTDEQADKIRLIENIQREDVTPVEEADALVRLSEKHKVNANALGKIIGISRTGVYNRMKLANAHPAVREKCQAGVFGGEIATAIARLPVSIQQAAIKKVMTQQPDPEKGPQGTKMVALSFRDAQLALKREFTIKLVDASFDRSEPSGDLPACSACDQCSDNNEALHADFGPEICIDESCFDAKSLAHTEVAVAEARAKGLTVIEGEEALKIMPNPYPFYSGGGYRMASYVYAWGVAEDGQASKEFGYEELVELAGDAAPQPILLRNPHKPHELIRVVLDEDVEPLKAFAPKRIASTDDSSGGSQGSPSRQSTKPPREMTAEQKAVNDHDSWMRIKRTIMTAASLEERTTAEMRMVVHALSEGLDDISDAVAELMDWPADSLPQRWGETAAWINRKMQDMSPAELGKLATLLAIDQSPFYFEDDDRADDENEDEDGDDECPAHIKAKLDLAAAYGINVLLAAEDEPEPKPEPAAPTLVAAAAKEGPTLALDLGEPGQQEDKATPTLKPAATFLHGKPIAKYRNAVTGETWTGRGLQPKWIQVALAAGKKLADFDTSAPPVDEPPDDAGLAESDEEQREVNA